MLGKLFGFFIAVLFLVQGCLVADWNREFSQETHALIEDFPVFQNRRYLEPYAFFLKVRSRLLHDRFLRAEMEWADLEEKIMLIRERDDCILKKRSNNNLKEVFVWELSCLLGASESMVPAFAMEIGDKKVVIQKMEDFFIGDIPPRIPPMDLVKKVPLTTYWKAHWLAFILGQRDLVGRNIGVNTKGYIRFFDAEDSFCYSQKPTNVNGVFYVPFLTQAFEWPQYREELEEKNWRELWEFQQKLLAAKDEIKAYFSYRDVDCNLEDLLNRLDQVAYFPLKEGLCFRDFYGFLFPRMNKGLDKLNWIVSGILNRNVDHGAALFHAMGKHRIKQLTSAQRKAIKEWIHEYVD